MASKLNLRPGRVHFPYDPVLANKLNFEEKVYTLEQTLHSGKEETSL